MVCIMSDLPRRERVSMVVIAVIAVAVLLGIAFLPVLAIPLAAHVRW